MTQMTNTPTPAEVSNKIAALANTALKVIQ